MDILYVLLILVFFAASLGLIKLCEKGDAEFHVREASQKVSGE